MDEEIDLLLEKEDLKWSQRAKKKKHWYCLGDQNIKHFHACASQWKKKNWIHSIFDDDGIEVFEHVRLIGFFIIISKNYLLPPIWPTVILMLV